MTEIDTKCPAGHMHYRLNGDAGNPKKCGDTECPAWAHGRLDDVSR